LSRFGIPGGDAFATDTITNELTDNQKSPHSRSRRPL